MKYKELSNILLLSEWKELVLKVEKLKLKKRFDFGLDIFISGPIDDEIKILNNELRIIQEEILTRLK